MSAKTRVQLTDGDRKVICECRQVNKDLSQEKLTALVAEKLNKPVLKRSTVTGTLKESAKWLSCTITAAKQSQLSQFANMDVLCQNCLSTPALVCTYCIWPKQMI